MKISNLFIKSLKIALKILLIAYILTLIWFVVGCETQQMPLTESDVQTVIFNKNHPEKYIQNDTLYNNGEGNYTIDLKQQKIYVTSKMDIISARLQSEDPAESYDIPLYNESKRFSIEHRQDIAVFSIRY